MTTLTVAIIDLGSNTFRLQISKVIKDTYKVIEDYKETVRIGDTVYSAGSFTPDTVQTTVNVLKRMRVIMDNMKVSHIRAVGTAPFRDASNAAQVIEDVKNETGIEIEVIPGEEEARLIYLAATGYFDLTGINALFVDVGGGSAEFSFAKDGNLISFVSTPLGCLRLTQSFVRKQKAAPNEINNMRKEIWKIIKQLILPQKIDKIIFTGGTVNAIAQVYTSRSSLSNSSVKYVDAIFLKHFINELAGKNYDDRRKIQGLEPERADISLAAALTVQSLLQKYKTNGFFTFAAGLRNGLTIDMLNKMGITLLFQDKDDIRYSKLVETGKKYHFEEEHAMHVTNLCNKLFLGVYGRLKLKKTDWRLLEAASILHDIGQHISYSGHHKHSYYLIKNTELVGYTDNEKDMIAYIAKYHRRDAPKNSKSIHNKLSENDSDRIYKLSAILRIADGLDRSHTSVVNNLSVKITDKQIILELNAKSDITMETEGVNKKKDMFESITGRKLILA